MQARVLNAGTDISDSKHESLTVPEICKVAEDLKKLSMSMRGNFSNESAGKIEYRTIYASAVFCTAFVPLTERIRLASLGEMDAVSKKAFLINIYNVLVLHGLCELSTSIANMPEWFANPSLRANFYKQIAYNIGGYIFTLDDIEHGLLRANSLLAGSTSRQFEDDDPRLAFALNVVDPRIHFALNCGAVDCPPVSCYSSNAMTQDLQLNTATRNYLSQPNCLRLSSTTSADGGSIVTVHLSRLFLWYAHDFSNADVLRWLLPFAPEAIRPQLEMAVTNGNYAIEYESYDWTLC